MAACKQISLRRASHSSDLMRDLSQMLSEEELLDVTLSCEDGSLSAHRILLASSSDYFRSIFARLDKTQYPVVILKDVPFADLKAIIEFVYRGEVVIPQSQLPSLVKSAEGLRIRGLNNDVQSQQSSAQDTRKRRRKRRRRSSKDSVSETDSQSPSEASTDEEEDHRTQITSIADDRTSVSTVGDLEPSRLLEQTMTITGDVSPCDSMWASHLILLVLRLLTRVIALPPTSLLPVASPAVRFTVRDTWPSMLTHGFACRCTCHDGSHGEPERKHACASRSDQLR